MTTHTTAIDHPSRRLVVGLPQTYDAAREHDLLAMLGISLGAGLPPQLSTDTTEGAAT
jgi:hypothetical protein